MLRVLLCFILLASWPEQVTRGAVPGSPPGPAPPQNRAPQTVSYIDVGTLYVGGSSATVNASSYFSDPDSDTLTYSVNSPSSSIATVSISGSTVTVAPVAAGTTSKIIVTARDPGGLTATQDFTATVEAAPPPPPPPPANRAPIAVGTISDVTLQVGGSSATRSVSGKFSDPDGDTLTYSVNSPNPSTVTVSISGSTVTITPVAAGTTGKIIVTATDPDSLTATQDFTATVEAAPPPPPPPPANRAPVAVGSISDVSLNKGGSSATRNVSGKFSDPDNDTLTYSVNSPNPSIVTVSISGSTVTIAPVATGSTGKIIVTARDPDGETAVQDFTATVTNQPPRAVGTISSIILYKKGKTRGIPVSGKFSDPNGDALTYSATSDKTSVATVSVSGSTVTVRSGVKGTATITVTAEDTDDATGTQGFDVTVINRIPQPQGDISKMTFYRGQAAKSTDVSDNFRDPDNDALTFTATSSDTTVATVSVSGSDVEVDPGVLGSARITVTATDTDDASNRHGFDVEVFNRRPVVSQNIPDRSLNKNSSYNFNASSHFSDPDGDQMTFSAGSSNTNIVTASVTGSTVTIESEDDGGDATVTVTATDAHNGTVSTDFTVTVRNRAPQRNGSINAVTLYKNRHTQDVIVSGKFTDPDGDALTYSASSSNTAVATASVSGYTVTITSGNSGSATITVKAEDFDKASATQSISVSVMNRAPEIVGSIADVNIRVGGSSESFDVSGNFSDPDGDSLTFSVDDPDSSVAKVSISGSEVTVAPKSEGEIGKVTVTATDTEGLRISEDFRVVVRPEQTTPPPCPSANTVAITLPAMVAGGDSVKIDVSTYFTIPQGVTPTYSANNPSPGTATVSISGDTLTITPITQGDTGKVIVTASANGCTGVTRDFNVSVGPPPPPPAPTCPLEDTLNAIGVENMAVGGDSVTIDVSDHFTNGDAEGIEYSIDPNTQSYVTLSLVGDTLTIKPVAQGDTGKIIVRAEKTGCTDATQEFNVSVGPPPPPPPPACPTANTVVITPPAMVAGGDSVTMDVSDYFAIPQGVTPTYSANNPSPGTAMVSISGDTLTITPITQGHTGKVIVTVSAAGCTDVTRDFNVTVDPVPPIAECPAVKQMHPSRDLSLVVGGNAVDVNLTSHFTNLDKSNIAYTIVSSNADVATASRTGTALAISPGIAGNAQVTVTVSKVGCGTGASQVFNARVEEPPTTPTMASSVKVSPSEATVEEGETQQFSATASDSDNMEIPGKTFTWTSSDTTVATISTAGLATAQDAGSTTITAAVDNVSATATLTVTEPPTTPTMASSVKVSPSEATVEEGETQQFSATASDSDNMEIPGKTFTWTSSDTTVATISTAGLATAQDAGSTTITAAVDNVSATATLTVTELPPPATCPALVGSIAAQTLAVGVDTARIDLTLYFSVPAQFDPDYVVNSTDSTVTTTSLAGDTLTVTPAAAGTDTLSVTVSKQDCDPVTQSFVITVILPCPAAITDAPIQDQTLFAGAGKTPIDLTEHFERLDQDGIEITVTSPNPEIAVLSIEGSVLKIDPKSVGRIAIVTVTATDTAENDGCDPASVSFMITVMDPFSTPWSVSGENVYRLTGNVGIGVSSPDQKLVVDGKIRAEEVYVPMTPADYVFGPGYDLMPLEDVARHIRGHGHLPGVASGVEMKAKGIGISRMQTLLLEKIEELSLYVIGQHEQLRAQGHSIDSQRRRLKLQHQVVRQLDHRLERLEQ